ncbi:MFS transporter [Kitasatospora sp. NPDC127067]|uniref:MFS transporter n=1 Tax=Kitasatospora sp. NPDC127067 TaxID=3347126 RepID=UPI003663FEE7
MTSIDRPAKDAAAEILPLSRNRNFILLWLGQSAAMLGARATTIALPMLVLAVTHSAAKAGVTLFAAVVPGALLQLHAGVLVDRFDRRLVMLTADVTRTAVFATVPVAHLLGHLTFPHLIIVMFIDGIAGVFFGLAEKAALPMVVPKEQITVAFARNELRIRIATLSGPAIGGALFTVSPELPFAFTAITYAISVATVFFINAPLRAEQASPRRKMRFELAEGMSWLRMNPFYLWCAVVVAGSNIVGTGFPLAAVVRLQDVGASPNIVGWTLGALGVGGLAGALIAPKIVPKVSVSQMMLAARWVIAICLAGIAFAPSPLLCAVFMPPISVVAAFASISLGAARMRAIPDHLRGRVESASALIGNTPAPLGNLLAGYAVAAFGATVGLVVLAGFMGVVATGASLSRSIRVGPTSEKEIA